MMTGRWFTVLAAGCVLSYSDQGAGFVRVLYLLVFYLRFFSGVVFLLFFFNVL